MTANKHDFGEPWMLSVENTYNQIKRGNGSIVTANARYEPIAPKPLDMHRIIDCVNACAGLSVSNGELERLLSLLDKIMPDEYTFSSGHSRELWKALNALRTPSPASPAVAKQIDEFIKDVDA